MVRKTANFTPLQAEIYEELASEIRNNEGIILHLCLAVWEENNSAEMKRILELLEELSKA